MTSLSFGREKGASAKTLLRRNRVTEESLSHESPKSVFIVCLFVRDACGGSHVSVVTCEQAPKIATVSDVNGNDNPHNPAWVNLV